MRPKEHWEQVYASRAANAVSWYQAHADRSLSLIRATGVSRSASIIDVGGGASTLAEDLLAEGYTDVTVLDISAAAIAAAKARLGERALEIRWIEADITAINLPRRCIDVWHDRAVFHFLTVSEDRMTYISAILHAVRPGGHVIIATFAEDGPTKCSGLPVVRYSPEELHAELGGAFSLHRCEREEHVTPAGAVQRFVYCHLRKSAR
jgi:SAM-dependent methyltransferase